MSMWLGVDSALVEELRVSTQACSGLHQFWRETTLLNDAGFGSSWLFPFPGCGIVASCWVFARFSTIN
jgi:hypothetical protein